LRPLISFCRCRVERKNFRLALAGASPLKRRGVKVPLFLIVAVCFASIALADDFKTIDGREYKNAKVSRVEPDGIVLITKSGISKVYFTELPKEVQERFHYDPQKAAEFTSQTKDGIDQLLRQRADDAQKGLEERTEYWSENPTPRPLRESFATSGGSALDRPGYGQSTTAVFLVSQYALNQVNAERLYTGKTLTISGTIKSIDSSGSGRAVVELFVPGYFVGKAWFMHCIFNDARGLEQYQAGNPIGVVGTVEGLRRYTLIVKDCRLAR